MRFREKYGHLSCGSVIVAIVRCLAERGEDIDIRSFTWTVVGSLFENGVITEEEFLREYEKALKEATAHEGGDPQH
ncbi:MAG: hypothetical protein QXI19_12955 [Candidatus Caldarchaeum sp.]